MDVTQAATHLPSVQDLSTNGPTAVYAGAAQLVGIHVVTTTSAHSNILTNGSGGTTLFTIPASESEGSWIEGGNMLFSSGIYIDPNGSATGTIVVVYSPVHDGLAGSGAGLP